MNLIPNPDWLLAPYEETFHKIRTDAKGRIHDYRVLGPANTPPAVVKTVDGKNLTIYPARFTFNSAGLLEEVPPQIEKQ